MQGLVSAFTGFVGIAAGYLIRYLIGNYRVSATERQAKDVLSEAKRDANALRKEGEIQAKAEVLKARDEFEKSNQGRRQELAALEERIGQRETNLDRKVALIDKKEQTLEEKLAETARKAGELEADRGKLEKLISDEKEKLQRVAGMTREEARRTLLLRMEQEVHGEIGGLIRRLQEQAKETAERESKKIVACAVERYSASHASEMMTSTVDLPSDDMKGRVIGREGRNIRALEAATGVNLLIDDTPEAW